MRHVLTSVILFLVLVTPALAASQFYTHTVRQVFGGAQSPDDARIAAMVRAKREVLEKAGTYLESLTEVKEGRLAKDEILVLAAGVLRAEIVSEKNFVDGPAFGIEVTAKVEVDPGVLKERVSKLLNDREAWVRVRELETRERILLDQVAMLERENAKYLKSRTGISSAPENLKSRFRETSRFIESIILVELAIEFINEKTNESINRALSLLTEAIQLDQNSYFAYINRAFAYSRLADNYAKELKNDLAVKAGEKCIADSLAALAISESSGAYFLLGKSLIFKGDNIGGIKYLNKVLHMEGMRGDLAGAAGVYLAIGYGGYKFEGQSLDDAPLIAYPSLIGEERLIKKEYEAAIENFTESIMIDGCDVVSYYLRASAYGYLKKYQHAIDDYSHAIQIDPKFANAYTNRGVMFAALGQHGRAIQDYDQAILLNPNDALAYCNRGIAYGKLDRMERTIQDFDQAIHLDPKLAGAYRHRGLAYLILGNRISGCRDLEAACQLGDCKGFEFAVKSGKCR